jgi:hypothetical protein
VEGGLETCSRELCELRDACWDLESEVAPKMTKTDLRFFSHKTTGGGGGNRQYREGRGMLLTRRVGLMNE